MENKILRIKTYWSESELDSSAIYAAAIADYRLSEHEACVALIISYKTSPNEIYFFRIQDGMDSIVYDAIQGTIDACGSVGRAINSIKKDYCEGGSYIDNEYLEKGNANDYLRDLFYNPPAVEDSNASAKNNVSSWLKQVCQQQDGNSLSLSI